MLCFVRMLQATEQARGLLGLAAQGAMPCMHCRAGHTAADDGCARMLQDLTTSQRAVVMEVRGLSANADQPEAEAAGEYLRQSIAEVLGLGSSSIALRQAALSQAFVQPAQAASPAEALRMSAAPPLDARRGQGAPGGAPVGSSVATPVTMLVPNAAPSPAPAARPSGSGYVNSSLAVLNMTFANASEAVRVRHP